MALIYRLGLDRDYPGNIVGEVDLRVNIAFQDAAAGGVVWTERQAKEWIAAQFIAGGGGGGGPLVDQA